ncbi:AGE family epimerase/isomerase [Spirosoma sp. SC4-14]|uniref:AGE family epimerase/isomerase n=1 Tax=Spirosoma sp. SC4-14 TaxID=3128900 RepID=UPI0030D01F6C
MLDFQKLSASYQQALLRQIVPFWLKHSRDELCGGYFDYLAATGEVIDGNKFVALQAQQVWAFAWLYNTFDGQPAWLDHARHGGRFLSQFAHNDTLNTYAELDRRGRPVAPASGISSDCFTMMAYAQLHRATGDDEWAMLAKQTLTQLLKRRETFNKNDELPTERFQPIRHLSEPVALLKAVQEMRLLLDEDSWKESTKDVLQEITGEFLDRRTDTLREYILPDGAFINTPEGRRLNVGLTFQTAGYILDACLELGNRKLALQVTTWCLQMCAYAWNEMEGGFAHYIDFKKQPVVFPEWTQKWAWVHLEAITALTKSYFQTRHPDCPGWIKRIHDYTFQFFPDQRYTGWYLAIGQNNQPIVNAKAIASIGCFSLIRCLAETAQLLTKCGQLQPVGRNIRVN